MGRPSKQFISEEKETQFKRLRKSIMRSQQQMAEDLGVAVSTIRRWDKGVCEPTFTLEQTRMLIRISEKGLGALPLTLSDIV